MPSRFHESLGKHGRARSQSHAGSRQRKRPGAQSSLQFSKLEPRQLMAANLVISEFLASNGGSLLDEDGAASDWIEILNAGDEAVDLGGWSLTDDANDLTKWSFPSTTLDANESLLVFASGKDRTVAASELHTNFRLSGGGEYLGLVENDGSTVAFDFGPAYPAQFEDISYGLATESSFSVLVDNSTLVRTLVPTDGSLGTTWISPTFDDSSWEGDPTRTAGVGYEGSPTSENNYASLINAPLTPLPTGLPTAYARFEFQLASVADINQLSLAMQFDDGFVAYLNGVEVASANAPTSPTWNSVSTAGTPDDQAVEPVNFDLIDHLDELNVGTNVLAFQLLNRSAGSSDLLLVPELSVGQAALVDPVVPGYFETPTPATRNGVNAQGFTSEPTFSATRGFYESAFDVTLATDTAGASIYYTTNGSDPTATNGTLYTGPVNIAGTTTLRAVAIKDDFFPSVSVTHTYLFPSDIINQSSSPSGYPADWGTHNNNGSPFLAVADYGIDSDVVGPNDLFNGAYTGQRFEDALTSIPTISLSLDIDDAFDADTGFYANSIRSGRDWERETSVEWWDPADDSQFQVNAGIRAHGGVSRQPWRTPKHGLRLYFRNDYGPGRLEFPLFGDEGVTSFDRLVFRSHYNDSWQAVSPALHTRGQFIQDPFVRNSFADMGNLSIRSRPVNVYINGLYWGVYDITERPDAEYFADHLGGNAEDYDVINRNGTVQDGNADAWNELINLVRTTDLTTTAGYEAVKERLDVENLVDYMLVNFYAGVDDWPHNNWVAANNRAEGGGFRFYVWDAEISMNQLGSNRTGVDDANSSAELYDRLRVNADFRQLFMDRALLHLSEGGALSPEASIQRYTELGDLVRPALVAESARWGDVHPDIPLTVDNEWQSEFDSVINSYLPQRTNIFINQLLGAGLASNLAAPEFGTTPGQVPVGASVSLINNQAGATLYYTDDGTDPRASGGGIAASAQAFSSPVSIDGATTITMRVRSGNNWSGLVSGLFLQAEPANSTNLRVSELYYNPADPTALETSVGITDADQFEFLELTNIGSQSIDLNGVSFDDGIEFEFTTTTVLQPGEYAVLVADPAAFALRHGSSARVLGQYLGGLSNGGEALLLTDANGETIQSFSYEDGNAADEAGWPTAPDGDGPSLVAINLLGNYSDPENWRSSAVSDGTPSAASFVVGEIYRDGHVAESLDSLARPDLINTIAVQFDQDVSVDASHLILRDQTNGGSVVELSGASFEYVPSSRIAVWDLSSLSLPLPAAFYEATLTASGITSIASGRGMVGDVVDELYVALPGDANLDGTVNVLGDGFALVASLGAATGSTWAQGDFNGDGAVNVLGDGFPLVANLGRSAVPAQALAKSSAIAFSATTEQAMAFPLLTDASKNEKDEKLIDRDRKAQLDQLMATDDVLVLL